MNNNNKVEHFGSFIEKKLKMKKQSLIYQNQNLLNLINNAKDITKYNNNFEQNNENTEEEIIIDENYIPNSKANFSFDLKNI